MISSIGTTHPQVTPEDVMSERHTGIIRWFNGTKGYGFVVEDDDDEDIFLHFSAIQAPGFKCLTEGQRVVFALAEGVRGPIARDVVPILTDKNDTEE